MGSDRYKDLLMRNHGVQEPCFGVKIGDLKLLQKRIKKDHALALELYDSGNYDAMYLAGLIADDARMTEQDLRHWAKAAYAGALAGYTVPWVASGNPHARALALEWIDASNPLECVAGWGTLCCLVARTPDSALDLRELQDLLRRVEKTIHASPDLVRYWMNSFIIALGSYVAPLTERALETGERLGPITADLGNNACQIPYAPDYIRKVQLRGSIGKKRKSVKC
jgi:3-methyladenine DNA glycosylase AlkD